MKRIKKSDLRIAFFGTDHIATTILKELQAEGFLVSLVITAPDAPQGRKHMLTQPPVKKWAEQAGIDVIQPARPRDSAFIAEMKTSEWDLFVVASYGYLIPKELLNLPRYGTLNVHPSLLPKLRGPSPIKTAILEDMRKTGVSIMLLDEEMDHGPILAQGSIEIEEADCRSGHPYLKTFSQPREENSSPKLSSLGYAAK